MSFEAFQSSAGSSASSASPDTSSTAASTPAPSPETSTSTSTQSATQASTAATSPGAGTEGAIEPPAYTPNFKFKVMDKEMEIPEAFRGAIKDVETEKMAREIFEKAHGMDHIKARFHETREQFKSVKTENDSYKQGIQELREAFSKNDFDSFFKRLQIPEEKVLQWVIDKAQYNQLPPDQKRVLDEKRAAEQRAGLLEKQNTEYQQQYQEQAVQAKTFALQVALEKPDVQQVASQFDQRAGKSGAFKDAVIQAGEYAWLKSNGQVDLTPEQAIQQVLAYWGTQTPSNPAQPPIIPMQGMTQQQVAAPKPQAAPTIPNVAGKQTASVSKPKPRSIDDLKQLAKKFGG